MDPGMIRHLTHYSAFDDRHAKCLFTLGVASLRRLFENQACSGLVSCLTPGKTKHRHDSTVSAQSAVISKLIDN